MGRDVLGTCGVGSALILSPEKTEQVVKLVVLFGARLPGSIYMGHRARIGVRNTRTHLTRAPKSLGKTPQQISRRFAMKEQPQRFVAFDMHQNYFMVGAVDAEQQVVIQPMKVDLQGLERWANKHLVATDEVVIEASTNTWTAYDVLEPLVARVVVAHPVDTVIFVK
jgi:hypothetical protein